MKKLLHATYEAYQYLVYKEKSKLFAADKEQIVIFGARYQQSSCKYSTFKDLEIVDNLTEEEWYRFSNECIAEKLQK